MPISSANKRLSEAYWDNAAARCPVKASSRITCRCAGSWKGSISTWRQAWGTARA